MAKQSEVKERTHLIAIIKDHITTTSYDDYSDTQIKIAGSITDWAEVNHEVFTKLVNASTRLNFTVIERPVNLETFICKSINDYEKLIDKLERERKEYEEKIREERRRKSSDKKMKKILQNKEEKRKLYERLKEEFEENNQGES